MDKRKKWLHFGSDLEHFLGIVSLLYLYIVQWLIDMRSESEIGKMSYGTVWEKFRSHPVMTLCRFQCAVMVVCFPLSTIALVFALS